MGRAKAEASHGMVVLAPSDRQEAWHCAGTCCQASAGDQTWGRMAWAGVGAELVALGRARGPDGRGWRFVGASGSLSRLVCKASPGHRQPGASRHTAGRFETGISRDTASTGPVLMARRGVERVGGWPAEQELHAHRRRSGGVSTSRSTACAGCIV